MCNLVSSFLNLLKIKQQATRQNNFKSESLRRSNIASIDQLRIGSHSAARELTKTGWCSLLIFIRHWSSNQLVHRLWLRLSWGKERETWRKVDAIAKCLERDWSLRKSSCFQAKERHKSEQNQDSTDKLAPKSKIFTDFQCSLLKSYWHIFGIKVVAKDSGPEVV